MKILFIRKVSHSDKFGGRFARGVSSIARVWDNNYFISQQKLVPEFCLTKTERNIEDFS